MTRDKKLNAVINFFYYGIIAVAAFLGFRFLLRYLLPALYPFGIAYIVSLMLNPVMLFMEKRVGLPRKVGAFLLVTLTVAAVFMLLFLIVHRAVEEIGRLADTLSRLDPKDFEPVKDKVNGFLLKLPMIDSAEDLARFWQSADQRAANVLADSIPGLKSGIGLLTGLFTGLFDVVLAFFVTVVASYYMTVDRAKIAAFVYKPFSKDSESKIKKLKDTFFSALGKYLKAYGLIMLITFTELFAAFTVLRIDYALLLAAITALVDILPVLGTGCVLIPWALICLFVQGDIYTGAGLIISYVIITVIRQIAEPKIVGSYMGIHPLATLAAMFAGLKLFGFWGILLLPMAALGAKNLIANMERPRKGA